jgi:hypothetical protein
MPTPSFILPTSVPVVDASVEALRVYDGSPAGFDVLPMSFTRASTATRTDSAGNVVSAVPYNLLQQSETFDNATWIASETTITANDFIAPNGTLTADRMNISGTNSRVIQSLSLGATTITFSVYLYSPVSFTLRLVATVDSLNSSRTITIPAGQWTRMSETFTSTSSITNVQIRGLAGGSTGDIYVWGAQVVLGTEPLPYQETVTRLALPRLDYRNADGTLSSTPRLLLEPQRTNSMLYSQLINSWSIKTELTITDNNAISPDGTQSASYIQQTIGGNSINLTSQTVNVTSGQTQVVSFYAKAKEVTSITLRLGVSSIWAGGIRPVAACNLINGSITLTSGAATVSSQNIGNGWYRFTIITAAAVSTGGTNIQSLTGAVLSPTSGDGFYLWGVQWEQNAAYPTTYIPTTTAAVTRLADACSVTGASSIIGQTAGTLFVDCNLSSIAAERRILTISDGTESQRIIIWTSGTILYVTLNSVISINLGNFPIGTTRVAFGYTISGGSTSYSVKVNNNALVTGTSVVAPSPLNTINLGCSTTGALTLSDGVNKAALYTTRLSDTELQALTTL